MIDVQTRYIIQAHTEAMRQLTDAIARQTQSIGELANAVGMLVEQGMEPDDQAEASQGPVLMSGKRN